MLKKPKTVNITVVSGVAEVGKVPKGVRIVVRDYDCQDCDLSKPDTLKDGEGDHYHVSIYRG